MVIPPFVMTLVLVRFLSLLLNTWLISASTSAQTNASCDCITRPSWRGQLSVTGTFSSPSKVGVGNCVVVKNCPEAANINQDVALVRLQNGVHPYFFAAWFNSLMGKQLVAQRSTGGINPFLGLGNLRGLPFPV